MVFAACVSGSLESWFGARQLCPPVSRLNPALTVSNSVQLEIPYHVCPKGLIRVLSEIPPPLLTPPEVSSSPFSPCQSICSPRSSLQPSLTPSPFHRVCWTSEWTVVLTTSIYPSWRHLSSSQAGHQQGLRCFFMKRKKTNTHLGAFIHDYYYLVCVLVHCFGARTNTGNTLALHVGNMDM